MAAARRALHRFLYELLGPEDEIFLMRFDTRARLVQDWTRDRRLLSEALARIRPAGGTALYEAVAEAIPMMAGATHRKKALVIISDGNDTTSAITVRELQPLIRQSEVLIYAIGLDSHVDTSASSRQDDPRLLRAAFEQRPRPRPFPIPGRPPGPTRPPSLPPRPPIFFPQPPPPSPTPAPGSARSATTDRVNVVALRDITDESGGRTEIIRSADDLDPATAGIADELSRQYYLGYPASGEKDGRWHTIRVEVRGGHRVRARTGFVAQ
jgi:VWFA-related protein